jgi:hypothetical protein
MARSKLTDSDLRRYLDEGQSQAEAAAHFGVSQVAISQRLKRMRRLTSRSVVSEPVSPRSASASAVENRSAIHHLEQLGMTIDARFDWAAKEARYGADLVDIFYRLAIHLREEVARQLAIAREAGHASPRT